MKNIFTLGIAPLLAIAIGSDACRARIVIPTNFGVGADAEVRDHQVTTNFGASTELASRIQNLLPLGDPIDTSDRHSVMYLKFDLSGLTPADAVGAAVQLTVRNNNSITTSRVYDTDGVDPDFGRNGLEYYGIPGATFTEGTITYFNAPGLTYDGNNGTKDFNGSAVFLGDVDFRLGIANSYYVGQPIRLLSPALDSFIAGEIASNPNGVAVIAVNLRNDGIGAEPSNWRNFNYVFNPKEKLTLENNPAWDSDITDPNNPLGGPFSVASNADGRFSPTLLLGVPEPSSLALLAGVALGMLMNRRRRG
jgi:hypothetical protein